MENKTIITKEYPYPSEIMDYNGYPTKEALDYIKNWGYERLEDGQLVFGSYHLTNDYEQLIDYVKSIWRYDDTAKNNH